MYLNDKMVTKILNPEALETLLPSKSFNRPLTTIGHKKYSHLNQTLPPRSDRSSKENRSTTFRPFCDVNSSTKRLVLASSNFPSLIRMSRLNVGRREEATGQSRHLNSRRMIVRGPVPARKHPAAREYGRVVRVHGRKTRVYVGRKGIKRKGKRRKERKEDREAERERTGRGGMQMRSYRERVIVGSLGTGQYRVLSSVREHSKHRATMAQNGRQLPNALAVPLCLHPAWKARERTTMSGNKLSGVFFR